MSTENPQKMIGGMFGIQLYRSEPHTFPTFLSKNYLETVNARSALYILLQVLAPQTVWLPSYLCDVMVKAVKLYPCNIRFYQIEIDLSIKILDWIDLVKPGDLVVFIDYFGFPFEKSLANEIKKRGGWVLEDAAQALLSSHVGKNSDFILFSPRKFLGVPDGGILNINSNVDFSPIQLENPPSKWWLNSLNASIIRREYDLYCDNRSWYKFFQEAEQNSPIGLYSISMLSKALLENAFDYPSISRKRVENYEILNRYLSKFAIFPNLPEDVVPLAYPIRLRNREEVRQHLFKKKIYPPVHWPLSGLVPENFAASHHLSSTILSLVCDQRYSSADMIGTAELVLKEAKLD